MDQLPAYRVREVNNYGGFFQGETVRVIVSPFDHPDDELDLTIDEHVFDNLTDRHKIVAGVALGLEVEGEKVLRAQMLGAPEREQLREAATHPPRSEGPVSVFAYWCSECGLWIIGAPDGPAEDGSYACRVCGQVLRD